MDMWRSGCGKGAWLLSPTEKVAESGHCVKLVIAGGGESIGDGVGDGIKAVDNVVDWCNSWDGEIVVMKVDCVGDAEGLGFGIDDAMAAVMLEGDTKVESVRAVEVPGAVDGWLVVGDDEAAEWQERGGIIVEGLIDVCPG
jgi:hypothetical protein